MQANMLFDKGFMQKGMNKRGISQKMIFIIIFGILVLIGIIIISNIVGRFMGIGGEQRTAEVSLDSLSQRVLEIYLDPKPTVAIRNYPLFIQENNYIIVAFNYGDDKVKSGCYEETVTRPFLCLRDASCLCLYEDTLLQDFDDDNGDNIPIKCNILPPDIIFTAPWDHLEVGGDPIKKWNMGVETRITKENLLLYGECDEMTWNKQNVMIEKTKLPDGRSQVYIARE